MLVNKWRREESGRDVRPCGSMLYYVGGILPDGRYDRSVCEGCATGQLRNRKSRWRDCAVVLRDRCVHATQRRVLSCQLAVNVGCIPLRVCCSATVGPLSSAGHRKVGPLGGECRVGVVRHLPPPRSSDEKDVARTCTSREV